MCFFFSAPSIAPSRTPSVLPTTSPSRSPSETPSVVPTQGPSLTPSVLPTTGPSRTPSVLPTTGPSRTPSVLPTTSPSRSPSLTPSVLPSKSPSRTPSVLPTQGPSRTPSVIPTKSPSQSPSVLPTDSPRSFFFFSRSLQVSCQTTSPYPDHKRQKRHSVKFQFQGPSLTPSVLEKNYIGPSRILQVSRFQLSGPVHEFPSVLPTYFLFVIKTWSGITYSKCASK